MKKLKLLFFVTLSLFQFVSFGQGTIVAVGEAELEKDLISITANSFAQKYADIVKRDFGFYKKKFTVTNNIAKASVKVILDASLTKGIGVLKVDVKGKEAFSYNLDANTNTSRLAHQISHDVFKELTGKDSIFKSKIIFVSDRDGKKNSVKEIYSMDFDGKNTKRLTFHNGTVISPALSTNGKLVLYSLIKNNHSKKRNNNLYLLDLKTGKSKMISSRKGINSGAVFMPGDKEILLTLSHQGNAELYAMNLSNKKIRRITKHRAPDVDPSINVRGDLMAFLSGRSGLGKPHIYIGDPRSLETNIKRVSFVGRFNATPRFSPDGSEIAFSSWLDNRFDIFRIDSNGRNIARLTKDFGSNEDPTYSNDGQFIAFSSQRVISRSKAVQNIYIMDRDGDIVGQITEKFGNCSSPRWSK